MALNNAIVNLNVGGVRFATSKETLSWVPDSFFSSLISGRISSHKDETGAVFIDRDPELFKIILNFLRTREVNISNVNVNALKKEAEYFGITPLVNRLAVCDELDNSSCGNVLFHGVLPKPSFLCPTTSFSSELASFSSNPARDITTSDSKVHIITGNNSWIAVAYAHHVVCYKVKESCGWQQVFVSPRILECIERAAINAKVQGMAPDSKARMVAVAFLSSIRLWSFQDEQNYNEIGTFSMDSQINAMFFIGSQLVAHGTKTDGTNGGVVGVWNAVSQHWQGQDVVQISSHDTAGAFLLLGGANGVIYYIDMQKFPLRLKDNDLLITELYRDHANAAITALSVYLTPKSNTTAGNWIEVAYGTANGSVCVIVQHPELVGQGFQLFQTFTVHRSPVYKVMLSEKHLVSVCYDNNHVRTWNVTRFRGMISTQPGSMPNSSFKVLALEPISATALYNVGNNIGPHGEREEVQVFIQKLIPLSDVLYVRLSSNGKRIAQVKSVDGSSISCFCLHECDGSSRICARPRRYLFTGHENGCIQVWDMTTALDMIQTAKDGRQGVQYGPTQQELLDMLAQFDVSVTSPANTPTPTPVSDILEQILHPRSSYSSISGSTNAVLEAQSSNDTAETQRSQLPGCSQNPNYMNLSSRSDGTRNQEPATTSHASKSTDIRRRHSQVIESNSADSSTKPRHNRHLSVSAIPCQSTNNSPFSQPGGIPLPGLVQKEVNPPSCDDSKHRFEKEKLVKKSSFRDSSFARNLDTGGSVSPTSLDDSKQSRKPKSDHAPGGSKGHLASMKGHLSGENENQNTSRGGAFRNSYKSAINDYSENSNSK